MNVRRTAAIARKECLHVLRDPRSLMLALAIPVMLILLFGYALNLDLDRIPTAVFDASRTPQSRDFLSDLRGSTYFSLNSFHDSPEAAGRELDAGRAVLALTIPADFGKKIAADKTATVQVLADGSDANTARLALNYMEALGLVYGRGVAAEFLERKGGVEPPGAVEMIPRAVYNADLRSKNNLIPGVVVIVLNVIAAMLASVTIAREWELGTMEQLIACPVRGPEIVVGKAIPYFFIGLVDTALAVVMGRYIFDVPLRGSAALVFATSSLFLIGAVFFGLFLSAKFKNQLQANQMALIVGYLPNFLLSGFSFAVANMPLPLQYLTMFVPGRWFLEALRGIYLKGIGLEVLWGHALFLVAFALLWTVRAVRTMKTRLDP